MSHTISLEISEQRPMDRCTGQTLGKEQSFDATILYHTGGFQVQERVRSSGV